MSSAALAGRSKETERTLRPMNKPVLEDAALEAIAGVHDLKSSKRGAS